MTGGLPRSVHVIAGLDPAHGGPTYTVPRLCRALAAAGAETKLYSVAGMHGPNGGDGEQFCWDWTRIPVLRALRLSSGLARALAAAAPEADVIHNHGLWLMPNSEAGRAAARAEKPLVVAPRGMLAPAALAFSPIKKRLLWALSQGAVVRGAACIHATSEQEHDEIREFGLKNPVAIIPNGIDLPDLSEPGRRSAEHRAGRSRPGAGSSEKGAGPSGARLGCRRSAASRLAAAHRRTGRAGACGGAQSPCRRS